MLLFKLKTKSNYISKLIISILENPMPKLCGQEFSDDVRPAGDMYSVRDEVSRVESEFVSNEGSVRGVRCVGPLQEQPGNRVHQAQG